MILIQFLLDVSTGDQLFYLPCCCGAFNCLMSTVLSACSICSRIMTMMLLAIAAYFECRGNNLVTKLIRYLMLIGLAYDLQ
jgi:hypothetical protein